MKKLQILNSSLLFILILIGLYIISNQLYDYRAVKTIIHINDEYAKKILLDEDVVNKQLSILELDSTGSKYILQQMGNYPNLNIRMLQSLKKQGVLDNASYQKAIAVISMQQL